jgi:hypothetical protein
MRPSPMVLGLHFGVAVVERPGFFAKDFSFPRTGDVE